MSYNVCSSKELLKNTRKGYSHGRFKYNDYVENKQDRKRRIFILIGKNVNGLLALWTEKKLSRVLHHPLVQVELQI